MGSLVDLLCKPIWHNRSLALQTALFAASGTALYLVIKRIPASQSQSRVFPSPRETVLPTLSAAEVEDLPDPPDAQFGARDVATPYGSLRVYEWGPENGEKVLLLHGISTPSIALNGVATELVKQGRRVMLFGKSEA